MLEKYYKIDCNNDIQQILLNYLDFAKTTEIEIEVRLGRITNKKTQERIDIQTKHFIVLENNCTKYRFIPGVTKEVYNNIKQKFEKYDKKDTTDRVVIVGNVRNIFQNGKLQYSMIKEKIKFVDIFCPNYDYDIRLSISKEKKIEFQPSHTTKKFFRERKRESYKICDYLFEFTIVEQENSVLYEVEIEVANEKYNKEEFIAAFLNLQTI